MLFFDDRDERDPVRGDRRIEWLKSIGAKQLSFATAEEPGFLFAGARPIEDYRTLVAPFPAMRDRAEEREALLRLDSVLSAMDAAGVDVPLPRTWTLNLDAVIPPDIRYPLFLRTPLSSWKLGGRISRVRNEAQLRDEAGNLRRAFGWDCAVLAREWIDLREVGSSVYGPVPFEIRVWVVDGQPAAWSFHYLSVVRQPEGFPPGTEDFLTVSKIASSVAHAFTSRLVVVDVAKRKKGGWVMIEAGPGSCAGTAHEEVFRHVCMKLRGETGGLYGDHVGGPLT